MCVQVISMPQVNLVEAVSIARVVWGIDILESYQTECQ
jgi:hypothetical protein